MKLLALRGQETEPKETKKDWLEKRHQDSKVQWKPKEQKLKRGGPILNFSPLLILNP